jgi:hypothetical protein
MDYRLIELRVRYIPILIEKVGRRGFIVAAAVLAGKSVEHNVYVQVGSA